MKRTNQLLSWALFLLGAGLFLLLKNFGVFQQWGETLWGGLFAVVGLAFIIWFIVDRERYWRAIAGFTLLGIGAVILLSWRNVNLGDWRSALVLFGVALGFWAVLLAHADNWWAVIPAGVLTVVGLLVGLGADLSQSIWLAALFVGLGLVFLLLYLVRFGQHDTRWAGVPAASLLLVGLVTWVNALGGSTQLKNFWPVALILAGLVLLALFLLTRRPRAALPPAPVEEPGQGAPVPEMPPAQQPAAVPIGAPPAGDIYDVLAQQPVEPTMDEGS
jgi:hypothetical protein